jgi:hypothetical protein
MWRTNKRWIAAKKAQQQKQAKKFKWERRFTYPKRKLELSSAKEQWIIWVVKNPAWHEYHWFLRGRKVCWETRLRVDPDWYRMIKTPSWWTEIVEVPISGWVRKKLIKNTRSLS